MNNQADLKLFPILAVSTALLLPVAAGEETFSVEVWLLEVPVAAQPPVSLPSNSRLELSSVDAAAWLSSLGGETAVSTHLVLDLAHAEDFSIELPGLGCAFHGNGTVDQGAVRFDLVSLDNPERAELDCALTGAVPAPAPSALPGKSSVRETRVQVGNGQTMVFAPVDRADGQQRVIVWRTVVN